MGAGILPGESDGCTVAGINKHWEWNDVPKEFGSFSLNWPLGLLMLYVVLFVSLSVPHPC